MRYVKTLATLWLIIWFGCAIALLLKDSSLISQHQLEHTLEAPSFAHVLGCDSFGRDLISLTLKGSLVSASFALVITLVSTLTAMILGSLVAFAPLTVRFAFSRLLETFLAFPSLCFALAFAAIRGPGWDTLLVALSIGLLPGFIRLVFVRTRELIVEDYILASRGLGASSWEIFRNHLFPHLLSLCRLKIPNLFSHALLAETTLSFLGVGAPIGKDTWGSLLFQGKVYLFEAPHIAFGTGIPLVLVVLALQILSETARD